MVNTRGLAHANVRIEEMPLRTDARGAVFEPVAGDELAAHRNVHVVLTEPGCVRGNHYHRVGTEVMTVVGPALVRLRIDGALTDHTIARGHALRFTIPPGISHAVQASGAAPCVIVSFNSLAHDPQHPDVVPDQLIEPSSCAGSR